MAKLVNRAKMSTATTGTGTITLGSAESGYQSFADAGVDDGETVRYVIEDGNNWEIGTGTYTTTGTTLTRTAVESSNADAAISLSGDAIVYVTATSADIQQPPSEGAFVDGDKTKLDGLASGSTFAIISGRAVTSAGGTVANAYNLAASNVGTGLYDYTFDTVQPNADYAVVATPEGASLSDINLAITNKTTSGFRIESRTGDNSGAVDNLTNNAHAVLVVGSTLGDQVTATWGSVTGTLGDQTDLQSALNDKQAVLSEGAFVDGDKTKLDGIEAGATADQTAAEIKTAYESNANTNAFTNAEQTKLAGIEANADVTDAGNVTPLVDAHLNTSLATTGQYLGWNGADYAWSTVSGYTDADVDTHLNTGTALSGEVLSWTGSDYDWIDAVTQAEFNPYITQSTLSGTTPSVNVSTNDTYTLTTSGNTTFTFTGAPSSGQVGTFSLIITAGGTHTLTWPASVDWAGGSAPDAPASAEKDIYTFMTVDGGTTWYGFLAGDAMA